jgi:outer membrane protein assembly factor BamB
VRSVAISADGEYIAAGTYRDVSRAPVGGKVYLFNKESNATVWEYTPTDGGTSINSITMSSDGQYITASATDGKIYLFHRDSNIPIWIYDVDLVSSLEADLLQAVISNDGKYIASFKDGYVFMLERENETLLWKYNIGEYIERMEMSADGRYIVVNTRYTVYLFENNIDDGNGDGEGSAKETVCQHGDTKLADDGFNHCICNNGEWLCTDMEYEEKDDDSNVTVTDAGEDEEGIPAPSLAAAVAAVAVIALRRPTKP